MVAEAQVEAMAGAAAMEAAVDRAALRVVVVLVVMAIMVERKGGVVTGVAWARVAQRAEEAQLEGARLEVASAAVS